LLKSQSATIPGADGKSVIVFRLGGLLDSGEKVKEVAGLERLPRLVEGEGELGMTTFCIVDESSKKKIDAWLAQAQVVEKRSGL
jgi:hypothetical protein